MYFMKSISDHIICSKYLGKGIIFCTVALALFLLLLPAISSGVDKTVTDPVLKVNSAERQPDTFEYGVENRKDPFLPFITETATTSDIGMDEIVEPQVELTGMQLFEPGQLNLVALLKKGGKNFAMVQDFTGKGYVISEGTKIGKRGVVKEIVPNKVIIEETAQTRAGQKIVSNTVMVLKKEGEE